MLSPMDVVIRALAAEQAELAGLLDGLSESGWHFPTRCEGWDVADVVTHLAQTDVMAVDSAEGRFGALAEDLSEGRERPPSIDAGAALLVERDRGMPNHELMERWSTGAARLVGVLDGMDLSTRVTWVVGELSARSLATTRLAETWIHTGDVASALDVTLPPTDRLRHIARLAWRTLPYAFATADRTMAGPVAFRLMSPGGQLWEFEPDEPVVTTISGPATELCAVAARRVDPAATSLRGQGPDAEAALALVRTYAL
jgi:uncharacterized protein (TIGR03084 family)